MYRYSYVTASFRASPIAPRPSLLPRQMIFTRNILLLFLAKAAQERTSPQSGSNIPSPRAAYCDTPVRVHQPTTKKLKRNPKNHHHHHLRESNVKKRTTSSLSLSLSQQNYYGYAINKPRAKYRYQKARTRERASTLLPSRKCSAAARQRNRERRSSPTCGASLSHTAYIYTQPPLRSLRSSSAPFFLFLSRSPSLLRARAERERERVRGVW